MLITYCITDDYRTIELLIQGVLYLFYEPNIDDSLVPYGLWSDMSDLEKDVNQTKHGTELQSMSTDWGYLAFSKIYCGQVRMTISAL